MIFVIFLMAQPYDPLILKLAKDYTFNEAVSRMAS